MSVSKLKTVTRFINAIMGFLTVLPVLLIAVTYFAGLSAAWVLTGPLAAVLLAFLLQEYCHNIILFIPGTFLYFGSVLPVALWAGFPNFSGMTLAQILLLVIFAIFALALFIYSYVIKLRKRETVLARNLAIPFLVIPIGCQFLCLAFGFQVAVPWILTSAVLQLTLRFINDYLIGHIAFLEEVRNNTGVPMTQIVSSNTWLLTIFFLVAVVLMTVACLLPANKLLPGIGAAFMFFVNLIVRFLRLFFSKEKADESSNVEPELGNINPDMSQFGESETSIIWKFLEQIMVYVVIAALVIGIIALVGWLLYKMIRAFYAQKGHSNDTVEFINPFDKKEKVERVDDPTALSFWERLFGSDPNQRVRKSWYKTVRHRLPDVSAPMSPGEISEGMSQTESERRAAAGLQTFYEKARYSNQECTKDDVAAAKQLATQLKTNRNVALDNPLLRNQGK